MSLDIEQLEPHMKRFLAYRKDQRELKRLSRPGMTPADAEVCNRVLSTDYAAGLAESLDAMCFLARQQADRIAALEIQARLMREQLDVQRRAIDAYQADRMREGRYAGEDES